MTELMKMVAPQRLYKVVGIAFHKEAGVFVDEGRLYAAVDEEDATKQARDFWTKTMGYQSYNGAYAKLIDRVGDYRVVLIADEQA